MRTLGKIAATLGVVGAIAVGSAAPAAAWYGYNPYYYRHYGYYHPYHQTMGTTTHIVTSTGTTRTIVTSGVVTD